jgi:hypothetical protein
VEVAFVGDRVLLRSSRHPSGPVITFTGVQWRAFCVAVATGDLAEE